MQISNLDHLVLIVRSLEVSSFFYSEVLGLELLRFGEGRLALRVGTQKINLHQVDQPILPRAHRPTTGAADLCFETKLPLSKVIEGLEKRGVSIEQGPVSRQGARGDMVSIYLRDPDSNLLEICHYRRS